MGDGRDLYIHELESDLVLVSTEDRSSYGAKFFLEDRAVAIGRVNIEDKDFYHRHLDDQDKNDLEAVVEEYLIDRRLNPLDADYHEDSEKLDELVDEAWSTMVNGEMVRGPTGYDPSKDDMNF